MTTNVDAGRERFRTVTVLRVSTAALREVERALAGEAPGRCLRGLAAAKLAEAGSFCLPGEAEAARVTPALDAAFCAVLSDLVAQGWAAQLHGRELALRPPNAAAAGGETPADAKARIRAAMEALRVEGLAEQPTTEFIRRAETRRLVRQGRLSVLDLVDNGADLAEQLGAVASLPAEERDSRLERLFRPRVQPVIADARCEVTDLLLMDVWRYFRLTWALPYRSTPGRTFPFLVRNDARPHSPVMGIGALASPVAQLARRDQWIGWTVPALILRLQRDPLWWPKQLQALRRTIAAAVVELRTDDLLLAAAERGESLEQALVVVSREATARRREKLQPKREPTSAPDLEDREQARSERDDGEPTPSGRLPLLPSGEPDWLKGSTDDLYVAKRARVLAELLRAHRALARAPEDGAAALALLEGDEGFQHAVSVGLRERRKAGIASRVLDLQVCGAVAPYGPLLAGKLVALVVGSRELRESYRARYSGQVSEIASQMAGRQIRRAADYCAVTTTSLYGVASSQYNRLALKVPTASGEMSLRWQDLGQTVGFGTLHLSRAALAALTKATRAVFGGANVTYRFGEGSSPSFRQAREGLELLVSDPDAVLKHEAPRRVYGLTTSTTALEALCLGEESAQDSPSVEEIASAWRRRWLSGRVGTPDVLRAVAALGPQQVKARLETRADDDPQMGLF